MKRKTASYYLHYNVYQIVLKNRYQNRLNIILNIRGRIKLSFVFNNDNVYMKTNTKNTTTL